MSDQPDRPEREDAPTGGDPDASEGISGAASPNPEEVREEPVKARDSEPQIIDPDSVEIDPDSIHLDAQLNESADEPTEAIEPVLSTSADEVQLTEPTLGAAEISEESAEAASLRDAAAEARAVEQEAEEVGTLVGGPVPVDRNAEPSGTAPAGGKAGDAADSTSLPSFATSSEEPGWSGSTEDQTRWDALFESGLTDAASTHTSAAADVHRSEAQLPVEQASAPDALPTEAPGAASDDASTDTEKSSAPAVPQSPWGQQFTAPHPNPRSPDGPGAPLGGAYGLPPSGSDQGPGGSHAEGSKRSGPSRKTLIILAVAGAIVLGLLIFGIVRIVDAISGGEPEAGPSANPTPGADGIIAENVSPLDLEAGACVLGFDLEDVNAELTTVTCTTPHNAQLLATDNFTDEAEFPGEEALNARGDELCNSAVIDENAAADYPELALTTVTPTAQTWADGDRRVDCYVVSSEGDIISDNLLTE